jgi:hypothetical protein
LRRWYLKREEQSVVVFANSGLPTPARAGSAEVERIHEAGERQQRHNGQPDADALPENDCVRKTCQ